MTKWVYNFGFGDAEFAVQYFHFRPSIVIGTEVGVRLPTGRIETQNYNFAEYRQGLGTGTFVPTARILLFSRAQKHGGMGSIGAMSAGSSNRYFQENFKDRSKFIAEGVEGRVEYKGPLSKIIYQLQGGLRSSMGYIGAKNLKDIKKNAKFIKITKAGFYESMVHSVDAVESSLNFKL